MFKQIVKFLTSYKLFKLEVIQMVERIGKTVRKIGEIAGSYMIFLPKEFVRQHGLKKGDQVEIYYDDVLHVVPITKERMEKAAKRAKKLLEEVERILEEEW